VLIDLSTAADVQTEVVVGVPQKEHAVVVARERLAVRGGRFSLGQGDGRGCGCGGGGCGGRGWGRGRRGRGRGRGGRGGWGCGLRLSPRAHRDDHQRSGGNEGRRNRTSHRGPPQERGEKPKPGEKERRTPAL